MLAFTAQKSPRSDDQATLFHVLETGAVRVVHVVPLGEVMKFALPEETAQNRPSSGDQQMLVQVLAEAAGYAVHENPLEEIITRFVPVRATAQKRPSSGDQHTLLHWFASGAAVPVQEVPLLDVMICVRPSYATAQNKPRASDQAIPYQAVVVVRGNETDTGPHAVPLAEVMTAKLNGPAVYVFPTAQKIPRLGDQTTLLHVEDPPGPLKAVQVIPSDEYIPFVVPVATNWISVGEHAIESSLR